MDPTREDDLLLHLVGPALVLGAGFVPDDRPRLRTWLRRSGQVLAAAAAARCLYRAVRGAGKGRRA